MICRKSSKTPSVKLWTIQPLEVWQALQENGRLGVGSGKLPYGVPDRYLWLAARLGGGLPWWAYTKKPDLRVHRHSPFRQVEQVRLELDMPAALVTVFPIWAWTSIYGGDFLANERVEHDEWAARLPEEFEDVWPYPEPWREQLEHSWELLFDPDLPARCPWPDDHLFGDTASTEAIFETLDLAFVREAREFRTRPPKRWERLGGGPSH